MDHILKCDDPLALPLARSLLSKLRAMGMRNAAQNSMMGQTKILVMLKGGVGYISIEGGGKLTYAIYPYTLPPKAMKVTPKVRLSELKHIEAGYNTWSNGVRAVTYNSGCVLRHRAGRAYGDDSLHYGTTGVWVDGVKTNTPFQVAAAAIFKGRYVAISLTRTGPTEITITPSETIVLGGIAAYDQVHVHVYSGGGWVEIGSHSIAGVTLLAPWNGGIMSAAMNSGSRGTFIIALPACIEDPIHFSKKGDKFIALITPLATSGSAMGPMESFVSDSFTLEASLSLTEDGSPTVSFVRNAVMPLVLDANPSPGAGLEPASAEGVLGADYGDDGVIRIARLHYTFNFPPANGTIWITRDLVPICPPENIQYSFLMVGPPASSVSYAEAVEKPASTGGYLLIGGYTSANFVTYEGQYGFQLAYIDIRRDCVITAHSRFINKNTHNYVTYSSHGSALFATPGFDPSEWGDTGGIVSESIYDVTVTLYVEGGAVASTNAPVSGSLGGLVHVDVMGAMRVGLAPGQSLRGDEVVVSLDCPELGGVMWVARKSPADATWGLADLETELPLEYRGVATTGVKCTA